jgi:hypothetical protein
MRVRRLIRKLTRRKTDLERRLLKRQVGRDAANTFVLLCRKASGRGTDFFIERPNLLLLQMGKVASSALAAAVVDRGINCFHCHSLTYDAEAARLSRLFHGEPTARSAALELSYLAKHTALNMLVRWYRANAAKTGRKLKVVSLTRDPATWHVSHLLQRFDFPALAEWHRGFTGADSRGEMDVGVAVTELLRQVAKLTVETQPSVDLAQAYARGHGATMAMVPPQPYIAEHFGRALGPLGWFDHQFTPVFGVNIRDLPELAEEGIARRELGYADILIVRYEDLSRHLGAVAHFLDISSLTLPPVNVTDQKAYAGAVQAAARAFDATDLGLAFARELRQSAYGRACGYDRLSTALA